MTSIDIIILSKFNDKPIIFQILIIKNYYYIKLNMIQIILDGKHNEFQILWTHNAILF